MDHLYAPWRHDYVNGNYSKPKGPLKNNCVFCHQFDQNDDEKYYIIKRFSRTAVMLNYYPYNGGHIMILPLEHKGVLQDLDAPTRAELMEATSLALPILEKTLTFVADANATSKPRLFMWKMKELRQKEPTVEKI